MPISQGDLDAYDWSWWESYGADLTAQLIEAYSIAYGTIAGADMTAAHALAVRYAEAHAATLLSGVSDSVQAEIRRLVADTLEQGDSLQTLQRQIRQSYAYSADHAATIARTETATSLGQGAHQAARDAGKSEKRWYAQLQETTCDECEANEGAGWIDIDDDFPSGDSTIPVHPNCMCSVSYRGDWVDASTHVPVRAAPARGRVEIRCSHCRKKLDEAPAREATKQPRWCRGCRRQMPVVHVQVLG